MIVDRLRIAMLSPISWPLPPPGYGPWEQVVSNLTEELVRLGHDVTLFAAAGTTTSARLVETVPHPLSMWPEEELRQPQKLDPVSGFLLGPPSFRALEQQHIAMTMEAAAAGEFDVVHNHLHVHGLVFSRLIACPMVTTLHGSAWVMALHPIFRRYRDLPYVSISDAERTLMPELNYVATVYNGIRLDDFPLCRDKEDYLLFAGRFAPEKGAAAAVQIALRAGMPLRMAGMIEPQYQGYFDEHVKPFLDDQNVAYLGMLSQDELARQYQRARAVLFPIAWCEPFGMVMTEAQASGTPIIGSRYGSVPEVVRHGATGFVVDTVDEAVAAVGRLAEIDPIACRANVETRFSAAAMGRGYEGVYRLRCTSRRDKSSLPLGEGRYEVET